jgi:hypothetical protein
MTTKTLLLTGAVIPALALLAMPCIAAPLQAGETLLAQQQEPAEKSDRPALERRALLQDGGASASTLP